jgi:hypothetical protein
MALLHTPAPFTRGVGNCANGSLFRRLPDQQPPSPVTGPRHIDWVELYPDHLGFCQPWDGLDST